MATAHIITVDEEIKIEDESSKNLREFDGARNNFDVVLIAEDKRFHVIKAYLAVHTDFFQNLFFNGMAETNKEEIELPGVHADDLQHFLECIYGEMAVNDATVEGIMRLADRWQARTPMLRCRHWLQNGNETKLPKSEKLRLFSNYNQEDLKTQLLETIHYHEDVKDFMPSHGTQLDADTIWRLLQLSTTLPRRPVPQGPCPDCAGRIGDIAQLAHPYMRNLAYESEHHGGLPFRRVYPRSIIRPARPSQQ